MNMKNIFKAIMVCVLFTAIAIPSMAAPVQVISAVTVTAPVGTTLSVAQEFNPSTGYYWTVNFVSNPGNAMKLISQQQVSQIPVIRGQPVPVFDGFVDGNALELFNLQSNVKGTFSTMYSFHSPAGTVVNTQIVNIKVV